jgi:hypothetical protein
MADESAEWLFRHEIFHPSGLRVATYVRAQDPTWMEAGTSAS